MRPPEFTGGNAKLAAVEDAATADASMRPPEFTGGNICKTVFTYFEFSASMRPPEFTGGNKITMCMTTSGEWALQ